jgi:hypothetical protein
MTTARHALRHRALRRPPATWPHPAAAARRTAGHVAVPAIAATAAELLAAASGAALMPRAESILASAGLSNGELGNGTRRRLLPLGPRERRANQPSMDRSVFIVALIVAIAVGVRVFIR